MAKYQPPRQNNRFAPGMPFRLSRSRVEAYLNCKRCFYLDAVHGIERPPQLPVSLNTAVDTLLKREFDHYRQLGISHPLLQAEGLSLIPFQHPDINTWRNNFRGCNTNFNNDLLVTGVVDDIWVDESGTLFIADYKSTGRSVPVEALDQPYHLSYKRQLEFYQWLFRRNGFTVSSRAYILYATGDSSAAGFDNIIRFNTRLIPYDGDTTWVEPTINQIIQLLNAGVVPRHSDACDFCRYWSALSAI